MPPFHAVTRSLAAVVSILAVLAAGPAAAQVGETTIAKWQHGRSGAVSITFDDGTINQFRIARPLLNERGLPGTFYIVTGALPGSRATGRFVGRPVEDIIASTAEDTTSKHNFFERASAVRYLGYKGTYQYHMEAGGLYEQGDVQAAYDVIDEGYRKVRNGTHPKKDGDWSYPLSRYMYEVLAVEPGVDLVTWDMLESYDGSRHEFGSHTITHPYLAVMDEKNIRRELRKSKAAIRNHLGREHTFSAELPFGTKNERVMSYGLEMFPALRNRMPAPYYTEIPRGSEVQPGTTSTAYTIWQRGPLSDTPMAEMKRWVDVTQRNDNIWLVLVFHGIEGIGWEPTTTAELTEYLDYIDARTDDLWVTTYRDGTKYVRERMDATVSTSVKQDTIAVSLSHSLGPRYDLPLTLRSRVPSSWSRVQLRQGEVEKTLEVNTDERGAYVQYSARPNGAPVRLTDR
ncbi:MAG: polysaccharide deacetylase family protein [Salinibacter sp.]